MNKVFAIAGGTLLVAGLGVIAPSASSAATSTSSGSDAETAARTYIQEHPASVRGSDKDAYTVVDTTTGRSGTSHVRFHRTYQDLPVLGGDFVVHLTSADKAKGASVAQDRTITVSTAAKVEPAQAQAKAKSEFSGSAAKPGAATLVVDARQGTPVLAWKTVVKGKQSDKQTPSREIIVTDARTGAVRSSEQTILTPIKVGAPTHQGPLPPAKRKVAANGTGNSLFLGSVPLSTSGSGSSFTLLDTIHGGNSTCDLNNRESGACTIFADADNTWGSGSQSDRATAAVDTHYGAALTFDYFKNTFGRNGIFGDGRGVPTRVHYGSSYVNAFWDGSQMTYGDGAGDQSPLVALDVAGHEMTHGVTENTAGLNYEGDAGGLNESTSDIFGTMVEFSAANASDTPDFLIGENIDINGDGSPLRYMDDPTKDGGSYGCWSSAVPGSDPHYSSGVGNHLFFLLANGSGQSTYGNSPTCNGSTVAGIGRDKAAAIWFGALTEYMTSTETYAGARADTISSATDLYGAGSAEVSAVEAAWSAVDVG